MIISIYFLGSGHKAKDAPNPGEKTENSNIYLLEKKDRIDKDGNKYVRRSYTVSGPTTLNKITDERSIGILTKQSIEFFEKAINESLSSIKNGKPKIEVKIKGHSRGGVIANRVYKKLCSEFSSRGVTFRDPIFLDPYAGPISRLLKENRETIVNGSVVYTVNEARFRSPMSVINAKIVIFTTVAHDRCQFLKPPKDASSGDTYYLSDNYKEDSILYNLKHEEIDIGNILKKYRDVKESKNLGDDDIVKKLIDKMKEISTKRRKYVQDHLTKVTKNNVDTCLSYLLGKSSNKRTHTRDKILFSRLAKIDVNEVNRWKKLKKGKVLAEKEEKY